MVDRKEPYDALPLLPPTADLEAVAVFKPVTRAGRALASPPVIQKSELQSRGLHLLALANTVRRYDDALTRAQGDRFNLFDILHVGHYEVRTHSPILAELLNPRGSHGQGAVFLSHFLTELKIQDFDAQSARVSSEVSNGVLGRLDIVITDKERRSIFIENKIYAGLQDRQLERYHKDNSKADLLFLTLNGEEPPDWEMNPAYKTDSFKRVFKRVSYKDDIVRWLESCRKEAAVAPGVREVITQYINLIRRLTQQNTSTRMNEEIVKAVTQDPTGAAYLAYANLRNANGEIRKAIIAKVNEQLVALGRELGLETLELFAGLGAKEEQCFFTTSAMRAMNLKFGLRCSYSDYRSFAYGMAYLEPRLTGAIDSQVLPRFKEIFSEQAGSNAFWCAYEFWSHHSDWDDETMAAIISGEFAPDLDSLIRKLTQVANVSNHIVAITSQS